MKKKLPPNFMKFFNNELKKWSSGKPPLGSSIGHELEALVERATGAIQKDIDEKHIEDEKMHPSNEDVEGKIIKESGSEKPIK